MKVLEITLPKFEVNDFDEVTPDRPKIPKMGFRWNHMVTPLTMSKSVWTHRRKPILRFNVYGGLPNLFLVVRSVWIHVWTHVYPCAHIQTVWIHMSTCVNSVFTPLTMCLHVSDDRKHVPNTCKQCDTHWNRTSDTRFHVSTDINMCLHSDNMSRMFDFTCLTLILPFRHHFVSKVYVYPTANFLISTNRREYDLTGDYTMYTASEWSKTPSIDWFSLESRLIDSFLV